MKILSAESIRAADNATIKNEPISSLDLMERAATRCFDLIQNHFEEGWPSVHIFAGVGNNGGDGLVLARKFDEINVSVFVYVVQFSDKPSADFSANLKRLENSDVNIKYLDDCPNELPIEPDALIIDAIFGSGLTRPISGWIKALICLLNETPEFKVSIDVPSGLFCDFNHDNDRTAIFMADLTIGFQNPKLAYVLEESSVFCGEYEVIDIGLDQDFIYDQDSDFYTTDGSEVKNFLLDRSKIGHKGHFGHALIMAGSYGKMGAAVLSARACMKSGIGLLTCFSPKCGIDILQTSISEAMCLPSEEEHVIAGIPDDLGVFNVIGIGPGLGTSTKSKKTLEKILKSVDYPVVLDADALNIISEDKKLLKHIPQNSILTPHPGEFRRLVGEWKDDFEKIEKLKSFSQKNPVITVLKGSHTAVCNPNGEIHFNTSGNPGMATAGSGDVLLGIITGLLGRGYEPVEAAKLGVFLHGISGDFAALNLGEESMKAGDIIQYLSEALMDLYDL